MTYIWMCFSISSKRTLSQHNNRVFYETFQRHDHLLVRNVSCLEALQLNEIANFSTAPRSLFPPQLFLELSDVTLHQERCNCRSARDHGVRLVHGNAKTFIKKTTQEFRWVSDAIAQVDLPATRDVKEKLIRRSF
ncbi:hypothetical protein BV898_10907 [Hypsibius exemplaris]|uniref:Uncharacterized protein n=1 Tax=Hypsibius exemplaris TaxID=2072580 RepID=A0A1W0WI39_HYPEX|nr:hypothetical protein BV898_10907 [Hypsibius exemplaris]